MLLVSRFMQAKPTLVGSRQQAAQTDAWRKKINVDQVLTKPLRSFDFMREHMQVGSSNIAGTP